MWNHQPQQSARQKYSPIYNIQTVNPVPGLDSKSAEWFNAMATAEEFYDLLADLGVKPQGARDVLPNSLKTEVICKANLRQWALMFDLRCSMKAHPDMYGIMKPLLKRFHEQLPLSSVIWLRNICLDAVLFTCLGGG